MKVVVAVAVTAAVLTGTATAAKLITGADIKDGSIGLVDLAPGAKTSLQGDEGPRGPRGPAGPTGARGPQGATGDTGAKGDTGAQGATGAKGDTGSQGATGAKGDQGVQGLKGDKGDKGDAWTPAYGVAQVIVQRGAGAPSVWGQYSTTLGSPVGDTTAGSFRFTCRDTHVTCSVSVAAYTTAAGYTVWPRILLHQQDYSGGGPSTYCEYGDGVTNNAPFGAVGTTATALTLGIGGSLDCTGSTQAYPTDGTATTIDVPSGYYDVQASFTFVKP